MTTIQLNNENKTQVEFTYDNGLPYKKAIRPAIHYGEWKKNKNIALIKVDFNDKEFSLFQNKQKLKFTEIYFIKNEIWIDLEDCYVVLKRDEYLDKKINNSDFCFAFLHNEKIINTFGFSE